MHAPVECGIFDVVQIGAYSQKRAFTRSRNWCTVTYLRGHYLLLAKLQHTCDSLRQFRDEKRTVHVKHHLFKLTHRSRFPSSRPGSHVHVSVVFLLYYTMMFVKHQRPQSKRVAVKPETWLCYDKHLCVPVLLMLTRPCVSQIMEDSTAGVPLFGSRFWY